MLTFVRSKRHLAQESKGNSEKSAEEVKKTKSYASLKNWGHDFLKAQDRNGGDNEEEESQGDEDGDEIKGDDDEDKQAGDKRRTTRSQSGPNKKRETRKGEGSKKEGDEDEEDDEEYQEEEGEDDNDEGEGDDEVDNKQSNGKKSNGASSKKGSNGSGKGPKKGDTVSWNWGNGQPKGKVLDVKGEK